MELNNKILQRVRMIEEKNGIRYAKTDGTLYKTLHRIYLLPLIYTMGINIIFILGMLLMNSGTDNLKNVKNNIITVSVCTVLMLAGYILTCFKFKLAGGILSIISEIFLLPVFALLMEDSLGFMGYAPSFYWRHFVPLVLLILLMVITTIIYLRAKYKTQKQYKRVLENLYEIYNTKFENDISDITDAQWNEFLNNYDPSNYKALFKQNENIEE